MLRLVVNRTERPRPNGAQHLWQFNPALIQVSRLDNPNSWQVSDPTGHVEFPPGAFDFIQRSDKGWYFERVTDENSNPE